MNESDNPEDPVFWFQKCMDRFNQDIPTNPRTSGWENAPKTRRERLTLLHDYLIGNPPLPFISEKYQPIFQKVMRKARTNYSLLVIEAMTDRSSLSSVTTDVDADFDGDDFARAIHDASGFQALHSDLQTYLFTYGEAYAQVIAPAEGLDVTETPPLLMAEDPRFCVGIQDPLRPNRLRAWVKIWQDEILDQQVATFYFAGQKLTYRRDEGLDSDTFTVEEWNESGEEGENPTSFDNLEAFGGVPVVRFENKMGMGEFEPHIDVLDRIVDQILQRLVIQWYQSFRQRAIKGDIDAGVDVTDNDDTDSLIRSMRDGGDELRNLFEADPGSLWMVPDGVDFWESGDTNFSPLQQAIQDDVKTFSAVTRTPLHMLTPDAGNQTAEGASLMRESLLDKIKDRQARQTPGMILLHQIAFSIGAEEARTVNVHVLWASSDRTTLQMKGDFIIKAAGVLSRKRILTHVMEFTPDEIRLNETELMQEAMMAQTLAVQADPAAAGTDPNAAPTTPDTDTPAPADATGTAPSTDAAVA